MPAAKPFSVAETKPQPKMLQKMTIKQTLVLIKPDGVARGLTGEVIKRFEQRGLKITALKLVKVTKDFAMKHYTEDITKRRGRRKPNKEKKGKRS